MPFSACCCSASARSSCTSCAIWNEASVDWIPAAAPALHQEREPSPSQLHHGQRDAREPEPDAMRTRPHVEEERPDPNLPVRQARVPRPEPQPVPVLLLLEDVDRHVAAGTMPGQRCDQDGEGLAGRLRCHSRIMASTDTL